MTQKFTTPCFIRKNTAELRKKLEELGYKLNHGKAWGKYLATFRFTDTKEWRYVASPEWDLQNNPDIDVSINCGTNEELFLALAALREDTDKGQWFCANEYNWSRRFFICKYDTVKEHINMVTDGDCGSYKDFHKATAEEIIEHFKD